LVSIGKVKEYAILAILAQFISIGFTLIFVNIFSFEVFPLSLFVSHSIVAFIMMYKANVNLGSTIIRVLIYGAIITIVSYVLSIIKLNIFEEETFSSIVELSFSIFICSIFVALTLFFDKNCRESIFYKF
jgi:hypothetical protein